MLNKDYAKMRTLMATNKIFLHWLKKEWRSIYEAVVREMATGEEVSDVLKGFAPLVLLQADM